MISGITIGNVTIPVLSATFTCDECGGTFPFEWSDEKSREEARANGFDPDAADMRFICDDCYKKLMGKPTELKPDMKQTSQELTPDFNVYDLKAGSFEVEVDWQRRYQTAQAILESRNGVNITITPIGQTETCDNGVHTWKRGMIKVTPA